MFRNPWGERDWKGIGEWSGAWSDGSREWTPYWMKKLNHRFGDDGMFWISYEDLLQRFSTLDRTRLFDQEWVIAQKWTTVNVSWITGYSSTKFSVEIKKAGQVVFVLSQLDERYFKGLEGQYVFEIHFLLQAEDAPPGEHIVRARPPPYRGSTRSVSVEIDLEPGRYEVLPKILATKIPDRSSVEDVVKRLAEENPQKLRQIGMNYDIANARGIAEEDEAAKQKTPGGKKKEEESKKQEKEIEKQTSLEAIREADGEEMKDGEEIAKPVEAAEPQKAAKDLGGAGNATEKVEKETEAKTEGPEKVDPPTSDEKDDTTKSEEKSDPAKSDKAADTDSAEKPWNAVCVLGLRVYSRDPDATIKLVKPKDDEEGAVLDVDGKTPAGATM